MRPYRQIATAGDEDNRRNHGSLIPRYWLKAIPDSD
jgi:hypothetical protein